MRGKDGEEIVALIPTDTDLQDVARVLRALNRSFKGAMVRDVGHSGTYLPKTGLPVGVMEVFRPAPSETKTRRPENSGWTLDTAPKAGNG